MVSACLAVFSALPVAAQAPPIRIMPLGDSITDGSSFDSPDGSGGYRLLLRNLLTTAGYNVDYIGTQTINSGLLGTDGQHEGHSGWRIDQLDTPMAGWLNAMESPDVVLMHIGTNDFGQNFSTATAIDRLDGLILKIATLRPYCHIIVTNLMERGEPANTNIQTLFNPYVQARVNAHAAAGRRVTFLDMRAAVPLADMPDALHPNQTGYDKMANAWLPAIQAVISPEGDAAVPEIVRATGSADRTQVAVTFSKPVADAAAVAGNFSISGGLSVSAASLDAAKRTVTLTTSPQTVGTYYTITVNGVQDRLAVPNTIAPGSTVSFYPAIPRGYLNHVPEAAGYTLAASLDIPSSAFWQSAQPAYSVDHRARIGTFDRVAYYMELQMPDGQLQYLWASMDAFTTDLNKIGVPTLATGAVFQQPVANLNVVSNVAGVVNGSGLTGNLEFWPTNYQPANSAGVTGASATLFDFGDQPSAGTYGSMQLHNAAAGHTLFALNNWGAGSGTPGDIDLGIGNDPAPVTGGVDWTFHHNAAGYTVKSLQVLVRTSNDLTPPSLAAAAATFSGAKVTVTFSEPVSAASITALNFSLNGGVSVLAAVLQADQRTVLLTTTAQPSGTPLTLTVSNVRDSSPNANVIAPGSSIAVAGAALPPEIVANVGAPAAGYHVVYSANLPVTGNFVSAGSGAYTLDDSAAIGPFTRVAYYLELQQGGGPVRYVWVSMDAFTISRGKIGIPTAASGAVFQQNVTNMEVRSNAAGIVTGTTAAGGNIEFWPHDYSQANAISIPNASATTYDIGDTRSANVGFGSMQVHNHDTGAAQTVFAINRFATDGNTLDIGIGNNPAPVNNGVDWTFAGNAGSYTRRVLHVLVLPGTTTAPAVTANVPEAANYQLVYSVNLPATGNLVSGAGFTGYSVNNSADVGGFSRIGYYMELQKTGDASPRFVWASMDAFTTLPGRIGIPTAASGAVWQQIVNNMNVVSNVAGVVNGTGIATGNIEFWPSNYSQANALSIPGANSAATNLGYDFGDTRNPAGSYGCMQIHNHGAAQTLLALNNWGTAANTTNALCIGIGNNPTAGAAPDYTFANNGASWDLRRVLQVYVLPSSADTAPPAIVRAVGSSTRNRLVVTFNEAVAESASDAGLYSIPGLTVQSAALLPNQRDIALYTSAQTPGTLYTVNVSGVRDRSPAGNVFAGSTTFTGYDPPAMLAGIPDAAAYQMVYRLAIPSASPQWNLNTIPYSVEEARYGEQLFDRVAYLMELDSNWVYASFDRHTPSLAKTGIPTLSVTSTPFQQIVTNMNVASNVPSIVTGSGITTGNIEFWGGNYAAPNATGIPNASAGIFDFGDQMTAGGHGSFQIHNHGASQVLMAYSNWGSNSGAVSEMGLGNHPAPSTTTSGAQLDWTFAANAASYSVRNLYVLVRPGGTPVGEAPVFASHPVSRTVNAGGSVTLSALVTGPAPLSYQWRKGGAPLPGQTSPWLTLSGLTALDAADYDVVVTGGNFVSATSLAAQIAVNTLPVWNGYSFDAVKNQPTTVLAGKLLARASDVDGDTLTLTGASAASAQGGTVSLVATGVLYSPPNGYTGADSFTVTISDGRGGSVTGTVNVVVSAGSNPSANQASLTINGDGTVDVLFYGIPGRTYQIQRSTDLLNWTTLQTIAAGVDGRLPLYDATPPPGAAFYRTRE